MDLAMFECDSEESVAYVGEEQKKFRYPKHSHTPPVKLNAFQGCCNIVLEARLQGERVGQSVRVDADSLWQLMFI